MKSVNYSQMVAVLIEAIKELNTKVASLEAENKSILVENASLKSSMNEVMGLKEQMKNLETIVAKLVNKNGVATSTTTSEQQ
jgi:ubiquinone biosynthesis protein UbiJ